MKREAVKKAVAKAVERAMPKAIKEEAEYMARDEVRKAAYEESDQDSGEHEAAKPATEYIQSSDPRIHTDASSRNR